MTAAAPHPPVLPEPVRLSTDRAAQANRTLPMAAGRTLVPQGSARLSAHHAAPPSRTLPMATGIIAGSLGSAGLLPVPMAAGFATASGRPCVAAALDPQAARRIFGEECSGLLGLLPPHPQGGAAAGFCMPQHAEPGVYPDNQHLRDQRCSKQSVTTITSLSLGVGAIMPVTLTAHESHRWPVQVRGPLSQTNFSPHEPFWSSRPSICCLTQIMMQARQQLSPAQCSARRPHLRRFPDAMQALWAQWPHSRTSQHDLLGQKAHGLPLHQACRACLPRPAAGRLPSASRPRQGPEQCSGILNTTMTWSQAHARSVTLLPGGW